jgi:hypothetical protein
MAFGDSFVAYLVPGWTYPAGFIKLIRQNKGNNLRYTERNAAASPGPSVRERGR